MIPPDIAIRLRMQTEAALSPVTATKEIATDLPTFEPGERFQAQIRQPLLPENTYRAVVNGREITLSLPETVKAGDILELVVVDRTSRMLVAQRPQVPLPTTVEGEADSVPQLSATAQMIGKLLPLAGQQAPPAALNQGVPLLTTLPAAGDMAAVLLPRLAQAASQSGLFYEAHQAQWVAGKHSTEALMMEPQARFGPPGSASAVSMPAIPNSGQEATALVAATSNAEGLTAVTQDAAKSIPAEIRSLVQQQLEAGATQRVTWQGEIWPGQTLEWQIARDAPDIPAPQVPETEKWNTSLALTTPRLGRVEAMLTIAGNTVTIRLGADLPESGSKLRQHLPALTAALNASGIAVAGVQVKDGET